jgi:hypothetical protein
MDRCQYVFLAATPYPSTDKCGWRMLLPCGPRELKREMIDSWLSLLSLLKESAEIELVSEDTNNGVNFLFISNIFVHTHAPSELVTAELIPHRWKQLFIP